MRRTALASLVVLLTAGAAHAQGHGPQPDLARARTLDQQGAQAYGDGRYNDAIRYFEESLRLGGPPFEMWNIAKCYAKLDQPAFAAEMLERYLATKSLPPEDREEASQQLESLRRRPSDVTLASTPSGAALLVDGHAVEGSAATPTTFVVSPGTHTFSLSSPGYQTVTRTFDARYGRAVLLDVPLPRAAVAPPAQPPPAPVDYGGRPFALRAYVGLMVPRYGSVGGGVHPTGILAASYRVAELGPRGPGITVGLLASATSDSWDNTVGAPASAEGCPTLQNPRSASSFAAFATGGAGWDLLPRLHVEAVLGAGVAALSTDDLGGDVFVASCRPAPAPRPAFLAAARVDFALTPALRISALPIALQLQPSFAGARTAPVDATGLWLRAQLAIGLGLDL
ncbi:MAG: Thiol-disulfide isomerase [Labilithrix sp.]|nr:Thiol-disulfide isomerase [Labilithrix sp.]